MIHTHILYRNERRQQRVMNDTRIILPAHYQPCHKQNRQINDTYSIVLFTRTTANSNGIEMELISINHDSMQCVYAFRCFEFCYCCDIWLNVWLPLYRRKRVFKVKMPDVKLCAIIVTNIWIETCIMSPRF